MGVHEGGEKIWSHCSARDSRKGKHSEGGKICFFFSPIVFYPLLFFFFKNFTSRARYAVAVFFFFFPSVEECPYYAEEDEV